MVVGLNMYTSMILLPFTIFVFCCTMINPIVKLECVESATSTCRDMRLSIHDPGYEAFTVNGSMNLQSNGNLTLTRFSHGFVPCRSSQCQDCSGKKECADYNYTQFANLEYDAADYNARNTSNDTITLPDWILPDCNCLEFCWECDELDLIPLPGIEGKVQELWAFLECEEIAAQWNVDQEPVCDLFNNFFKVVAVGALALAGLGITFMVMCFLEYVNFHLFCSGRCTCLFISPWKKKLLFVTMLTGPLFLLIWLLMRLYKETDTKLNAYFAALGVQFNYNWNTRGYVMWWICIGNVCLSILALLVSGTTERHLVTMENYRRGINYAAGEVDPLVSKKHD